MMQELPGGDLIEEGLRDLARGAETVASCLVSIGEPRLRDLGFTIPPNTIPDPEDRLYALLARTDSDSAHSRYNALIRRLVGFERAGRLGGGADQARIRVFLRRLGQSSSMEARVYLVGGTTSVLEGWRETTVDVSLKIEGSEDELLRAIPELKEELRLNVELASPDHFLPELPGWRDRSPFIVREGGVDFFHYDFYAQALAKVERGHKKDLQDVREMIRRGLVEPAKALELFARIEPQLYRFPAIDPASLRRAVESAFGRPPG